MGRDVVIRALLTLAAASALSLSGCAPTQRPQVGPAQAGCAITLSADGVSEDTYRGMASADDSRSALVCPFTRASGTVTVLFPMADPGLCRRESHGGLRVIRSETLTFERLDQLSPCIPRPDAPLRHDRPIAVYDWRWPVSDASEITAAQLGVLKAISRSGLPIYRVRQGDGGLCLEVDRTLGVAPSDLLGRVGFETPARLQEVAVQNSSCRN